MATTNQAIAAIRGMHDILPGQTSLWYRTEQVIREVLNNYGYQEIRLPIVEKTELFKRSIGEVTDIVEKEMYTFDDRNGDSLTLRPEGTAGCLRACLEHGLLQNQVHRLWYYGAMFRHERPQKGRYRQFYQFGVETYGIASADIDAEVIMLSHRLWQRLGIANKVTLQLNSLGTVAERAVYRESLVDYFNAHLAQLDEDSVRRLETNPLRILDSKNPAMQALIAQAPELMDYLGDESRLHFQTLTAYLDAVGIVYQLNPRLVRGLDYYGKTVFEWVTTELGSQGTVCAGGRYDGLISQLGGPAIPGIGFAMGLERVALLLGSQEFLSLPDLFIATMGGGERDVAFRLMDDLIKSGVRVEMDYEGKSLKSQMRRADKLKTRYSVVIGGNEVESGRASFKRMEDGLQTDVSLTVADIQRLVGKTEQ